MKRFLKHFRYGQKGFTLIELLVVIGILGAIAAIVVPNVGSFIGRGKEESYQTELHNVQTSMMAMLVDSETGKLNPIGPTKDMSTVKTTDTTPLVLSDYLTGLWDDPDTPLVTEALVTTGCEYEFLVDGTVIQTTP